jgi:hypothetical protein
VATEEREDDAGGPNVLGRELKVKEIELHVTGGNNKIK